MLSPPQHLICGSCGIIWTMEHKAVQKKWRWEWSQFLGDSSLENECRGSSAVENHNRCRAIFHPEIKNMNIQMYFSLLALCLFCSQIIVSQILSLSRSLSCQKCNSRVMYRHWWNKVSIDSLFSVSVNKHFHNCDLNIKPEDMAWEGRRKRTKKQNHIKIWRCDSRIYSGCIQFMFWLFCGAKSSFLIEFSQCRSTIWGLDSPLVLVSLSKHRARWSFPVQFPSTLDGIRCPLCPWAHQLPHLVSVVVDNLRFMCFCSEQESFPKTCP